MTGLPDFIDVEALMDMSEEFTAPDGAPLCEMAGIASDRLMSGCGSFRCKACADPANRLNIGPCVGGDMNGSLLSSVGAYCEITSEYDGRANYIWVELAPMRGCWMYEPDLTESAMPFDVTGEAVYRLMLVFFRAEARFHDHTGDVMLQMGSGPDVMQ